MSGVGIGFLVLAIATTVFFRLSRQRRDTKDSAQCGRARDISGDGLLATWRSWAKLWRMIQVQAQGYDLLDDFFAPAFGGAKTIQETTFDGSIVISTVEPANVKAMLATQFEDFEIGQLRINQFYPLLGDSIFSSDGSAWEHSRRLFRPQFSRDAINNLESIEDASQALINVIGPTNGCGWTRDVQLLPLLCKLTLDTATQFLFGESVNSQSSETNAEDSRSAAGWDAKQVRSRQFRDDFELVSLWLVTRVRYQNLYWLVDGPRYRAAAARIRQFTDNFVQAALDQASKPRQKRDLVSALTVETRDRKEVRDQTLAILAAGRDTTASLLAWCFVRLALHPELFAQLRSVVVREFKTSEAITLDRLRSCRCLQHFLQEVLRLHPAVPVNNRRARADTTLPVGGGPDEKSTISVAKGQVVIYSVYLMHRREDLWGKDAAEFKPARWETTVPSWYFLPFGGGPRACLGQQFALMEVSYVVVKMLQHFDAIEPVDVGGMRAMRKALGLTMWPADHVNVRFRKA